MTKRIRLILYSKAGCHLCEGLQAKLEQIKGLDFELDIRDITTRSDWFAAFQYEVPVLYLVRPEQQLEEQSQTPVSARPEPVMEPLPRPSPRATVQQLERMLQKHFEANGSQ